MPVCTAFIKYHLYLQLNLIFRNAGTNPLITATPTVPNESANRLYADGVSPNQTQAKNEARAGTSTPKLAAFAGPKRSIAIV